MRKRLAKGLALVLAVATALGCAGCGGGQGGSGKNNAKVVNNCYETGYPIAEETVKTIRDFVDQGGLFVLSSGRPLQSILKILF